MMLFRSIVMRSAAVALSLSGSVASLAAQRSLPVTAAEAAFHVREQEEAIRDAISFRQAHYPVDSMLQVIAGTGAQWLAHLQGDAVHGMQLDPSSEVGASARQDAYAKAQIAARLATPGLSFRDKAFTYLTAVQSFTNEYTPERFPIAEQYLDALDALGDSAAYWQLEARKPLIQAYFHLGRSDDVIRIGVRALQLVRVLSFHDRGRLLPSRGSDMYAMVIDALAGRSDGRPRIDSLNRMLESSLATPPHLAALDSEFIEMGMSYRQEFTRLIAATSKLGTMGAPLVSNYWLNRPSRDSAIIPVSDGKIHVIEMGSYDCPACVIALHGMQRLHNSAPDIAVVMLSWTQGFWANRLIDADEEAAHLTTYFLDHEHITIPIGIWKAKKAINEDGGLTPENCGPNLVTYPAAGKPMIWVIDGRGMIRHVFLGFSRETETQLLHIVQFLQREAANRSVGRDARPTLQGS